MYIIKIISFWLQQQQRRIVEWKDHVSLECLNMLKPCFCISTPFGCSRCRCNSPGGDSCQHASRKRRRGMIEKKRRDRINASLGELRRLVPAAARDPHSGKLEKAEILQLTVEHLRTLRNKGEFRISFNLRSYHWFIRINWIVCKKYRFNIYNWFIDLGRSLISTNNIQSSQPVQRQSLLFS